MAQNISILGANYSAVPAVNLPKTGGGTAKFTDVTDSTAIASDVATGKYFYSADGTRTAGTNSGGGGASNFVHGEFHTNSTYGAQTIDIPYTGNGYAIMATVVVKGGAYVSGTAWYATVSRYAVGVWSMTKSDMAVVPTNQTGKSENYAVVQSIFKNSTSSATSYSRNSAMTNGTYTGSSAVGNVYSCVVFNNAKKMSVYVQNTSYGLMKNIDYEYFIVYSE